MKQRFTRLLLAAALLLPAGLMAQDCTITLPYSMNFDGLAAGGSNFVPCWTRVDSATSGTAVLPNIYNYGGTHGNVLNFNGNSASSTGTMRAATPLIPAALNALEISFVVYKNTLRVYAATDPTDQTTYHLIGSYAPGYVWTTYEVRTDTVSGLPAENGYLVFAANYSTSSYGNDNPYLDDLTISALNSCARPDQVTVEQFSNNSADLSWTAVTGAQSYRILYDTVNDPITADEETTIYTTTTLTNLQPNKQYYVWVQTVCAPGDYSDYRTATFTTDLDCYPPVNLQQVSTSFAAASFGWETDPRGNSVTNVWTVLRDLDDSTATVEESSTGTTTHIVSNLDPTHSYEIDFYTVCGTDTAEVATLPVVLKVCGESQLASLPYNYDMHPVPAGYNYGYAQMMYPADVFLDMDTIRGIALHRYLLGSASVVTRTLSIWMHCTTDTLHNSAVSVTGMTQVANNVSYTLPVQEWDTLYFTTPFIYTPGTNVILTIDDNTGSHVTTSAAQWMWHEQSWKTQYKNNDNSNPDPTAVTGVTNTQRCPDMHFVGNCNADLSCVAPVVAVTSVDSASAEINWVGDGGNFCLEYRTTGALTWTVASTNAGTPYTLSGLLPATIYEVRVGVMCDGATEWRYSDIVNFTTGCALMDLPLHFTQTEMCAAADNAFTPCWNWSQYFYKGRLTDSHRGYVRNVGNGEWFMLPAISDALNGARLRTWAASSTDASVKVGIASLSDCSDVVWVDTIFIPSSNVNTSTDEYISYLDNYVGTGNRVVVSPIVTNNFHYVFFFDFHVEPIEDCRPVEHLVLDSSTATSLSVSWAPRSGATQWAVYVNGTQRTVVNGQPHCTLTGLNAYTLYEVSVRSLCVGEDSSALTSEHFRTACSGEQCTFTIDAHASAGEGWKGAHLHIFAGSEQIEDFTMLQDSNLSKSYFVCANMPLLLKWYSGNADSECSFELRNAAGDTVYSLAEGPNHVDTLYVTNNICADVPVPSCVDHYASLTKSACDEYLWHGRTLTASGTYCDTVEGVVTGGCDSIYTLTLTIHESYSAVLDSTAEESFTWHGTTYTVSGTYSWSDTTVYGCDSTETLHLIVTHSGVPCENQYSSASEVACDSYIWRGRTLTADGTYYDTVTGAVEGGCDSIYSLTLILHQSAHTSIDVTAEGSYTWHGATYTESGTYSWTGTTVNNCDSVVTLHLTITGTQGIDAVDGMSLSLYPNPTTGLVNLTGDGIETVEVYDATGRKVLVVRDSNVIDLSTMATGIYTLRVTMSEGMTVRKVMKR